VGCDQVAVPCSLKEKVLEQEEKYSLEEEELEKLFLKKIFVVILWRRLWTLGVTVMSYSVVLITTRKVLGRGRNLKAIVSR
jgi:hypothetical protein